MPKGYRGSYSELDIQDSFYDRYCTRYNIYHNLINQSSSIKEESPLIEASPPSLKEDSSLIVEEDSFNNLNTLKLPFKYKGMTLDKTQIELILRNYCNQAISESSRKRKP